MCFRASPNFKVVRIFLKVKAKAKENRVEKIDGDHFQVLVKEPPVRGRANLAVIRIIAGYFNLPVAKVRIIGGFTSRQKTVEITK